MEMPEQSLMNELNKLLRAKINKNNKEGQYQQVEISEEFKSEPQQVATETLPPGFYQERELVKLLLMYGDKEIDVDGIDDNKNPIVYKISVASLIIDDLKNDDIFFRDEVHRIIFDIYDKALDGESLPKEQFFTSHENTQIAELAANLLTTPYKLDNWDGNNRVKIKVKTEEDVLATVVSSSILRYKDLIIDERRNEIMKELMATHDIDDQMILLAKKKKLDDLRIKINKKLEIVVAR